MNKRGCLFARWVSEFDVPEVTQWWYCIRDEKISLENLNSKQRYRVKRGLKFCRVERVDPHQYGEGLYNVLVESMKDYPLEYRGSIETYETFSKGFDVAHADWFAVFDAESNGIIGYSTCHRGDEMAHLTALKVMPEHLNKDVNAALVFKIVEFYINEKNYLYVSDGARNIKHQTKFQEYLVHNLGFRYAYCKLNIQYNKYMGLVVKILYPFRNVLNKIRGNNAMLYNVYCVLKQEEIARTFK